MGRLYKYSRTSRYGHLSNTESSQRPDKLLMYFLKKIIEGGERTNGSADFENIFAGFRIQSVNLTDFRILQLQRIADSSIFWARISDSARKWKSEFG